MSFYEFSKKKSNLQKVTARKQSHCAVITPRNTDSKKSYKSQAISNKWLLATKLVVSSKRQNNESTAFQQCCRVQNFLPAPFLLFIGNGCREFWISSNLSHAANRTGYSNYHSKLKLKWAYGGLLWSHHSCNKFLCNFPAFLTDI